jgi:DNA recombination protein RmuC
MEIILVTVFMGFFRYSTTGISMFSNLGVIEMIIVCAVLAVASGVVGFFVGVQRRDKEAKAESVVLQTKIEQLQQQCNSAEVRYEKLKAQQDEREASHAREAANFEQQKNSLSEHFKVLSNEILEAKAKALQDSSKLTLNAVMSPFQQSIDSFKKEVQEIHHRETTQQGELRKELEQLKELNQKITLEAHELSTALRGQKKLQGNWGELVLENVRRLYFAKLCRRSLITLHCR